MVLAGDTPLIIPRINDAGTKIKNGFSLYLYVKKIIKTAEVVIRTVYAISENIISSGIKNSAGYQHSDIKD